MQRCNDRNGRSENGYLLMEHSEGGINVWKRPENRMGEKATN